MYFKPKMKKAGVRIHVSGSNKRAKITDVSTIG